MDSEYEKFIERLQGEYFLIRKGRLYHLVGGVAASLIAIFSIFIGSALVTINSSAAKTVEREIEQTAEAALSKYQSIAEIERQMHEKLKGLQRVDEVERRVQTLQANVVTIGNRLATHSKNLTARLVLQEERSTSQQRVVQTLMTELAELERTSDANQQAIALIYSPFVEIQPNYCVPQHFDRDPRVAHTLKRLSQLHGPLLELYADTPKQLLPKVAPATTPMQHLPVALNVSDVYGHQRRIHVDDVAGSFYIPTLDHRGATRILDYRVLEQLDGRLANNEPRDQRVRGTVAVRLPVGHVLTNKSATIQPPLLQRGPSTATVPRGKRR